MKQLRFFPLLLVIYLFPCQIYTQSERCSPEPYLQYPKPSKVFKKNERIYIKLNSESITTIAFADLNIDGQWVNKRKTFPFEWGKPGTSGYGMLRRLDCGRHKIRIKYTDRCGHIGWLSVSFEIECDQSPSSKKCNYIVKWTDSRPMQFKQSKDRPLKIGIEVNQPQKIRQMSVFIGQKLILRDDEYPYTWSIPKNVLGQLACRNHHIKVQIKDKCGNITDWERQMQLLCQ